MRRLTRPSTTVRAGSGPAATAARCSNIPPQLHAGRTQSVVGPAPRWREKNKGRPPLPVFDAPPVLRLVSSGHSMLGDDMPGFDTPAAIVTM